MVDKICIGVVLYKTSIKQFERLIRSVLWQTERGVDISILLRSNDGHDYVQHVSLAMQLIADRKNIKISEVIVGSNVGFGAAHNELCDGAADEGCDLYIGANPDGLFHHKALAEVLSVKNRNERNTLFELMQFPQEHPKIYDCFFHETLWCSGACFAINPGYFKEIGGFDDNIFMYCEDVDLSWRVRATGGKCLVVVNALFYHDMSDDRDRFAVKVQMLRSGRYLAWKWRNRPFMEAMETEMLSAGISDEIRTLPHSHPSRVDYSQATIEKTCDFKHGFSFGPTRW